MCAAGKQGERKEDALVQWQIAHFFAVDHRADGSGLRLDPRCPLAHLEAEVRGLELQAEVQLHARSNSNLHACSRRYQVFRGQREFIGARGQAGKPVSAVSFSTRLVYPTGLRVNRLDVSCRRGSGRV